jgi:hypothetical protein
MRRMSSEFSGLLWKLKDIGEKIKKRRKKLLSKRK